VNTTATHANWFAQSHYHSLENVPISVTIDGTPHDGYITGGNTSGNPKGGPGG